MMCPDIIIILNWVTFPGFMHLDYSKLQKEKFFMSRSTNVGKLMIYLEFSLNAASHKNNLTFACDYLVTCDISVIFVRIQLFAFYQNTAFRVIVFSLSCHWMIALENIDLHSLFNGIKWLILPVFFGLNENTYSG